MSDISFQQQTHMHQQQKLLMTTAMKQAFYAMQLPLLELSEWVKTEIESNPALEIELPDLEVSEGDFFSGKVSYCPKAENLENLTPATVSLFEHLVAQARFHFNDLSDIALAQWIIGHLNERGFLTSPLSELSAGASLEKVEHILGIVQTFDPPGVGARTLQESLLIQLKLKQKKGHAYTIVETHFEDLMHNRLPVISKQLNISVEEVSHIIARDISILDLHPGHRFLSHATNTIVPDVFFFCVDEAWKIEVNEALLPSFQLARTYKNAMRDNLLKPEECTYLRRQLTSGKWLKHILSKRRTTLLRIGKFLLKAQSSFFQDGHLSPLTMSEVAAALNLHESTIARAVANKYLACPQGTFALKDFFSHSLRACEGKNISRHTMREKLKALIDREDKKKPYSDEEIKSQLCTMGIPCARRTVTKYRKLLHIAPAARRKRWS